MSMDSVTFLGGPDPAVEIGFTLGAGAGSDQSAERAIYVMAEGNGGGTGVAGDVEGPFADANEAEDFFGGAAWATHLGTSPGAWLCHLIFDMNPNAVVYGVYVAPLATTTKASNTIVFATTATGAGVCDLNLLGCPVSVEIALDDTPTVVGDALVAAFELLSGPNLPPLHLSNAAGTVTVEFTNKGTQPNGAPLEKIGITSGIGMTCTVTGNLATGAGTDVLTTPLAAIAGLRTPLLVGMWNDANGTTGMLDLIRIHCNTKSNPQDQLWSKFVTAKTDTRSNIVSWWATVDTNDTERGHAIGWTGARQWWPMMAADYAAAIASTDNLVLPINGTDLKHCSWFPPAATNRHNRTDRVTMLRGGVCPGRVVDEKVTVTRYIMGRFDLGVVDGNAVDVLDYLAVDLAATFANLGPQNIVPAGSVAYGDDKITLDQLQGMVVDRLYYMEREKGYLYDLTEANVKLITTTYLGGGAVKVKIPKQCLQVVPGLHNIEVEGNHQVDAAY